MCLSKETRLAIKGALRAKGIAQADLARQMGKSTGYLRSVLSGHSTVSMKMADEIAAALGYRVKVILEKRKDQK